MAMRGERLSEREIASRRVDDTVASVRLERSVRAAAATSLDEGEFVRRLHQAGVLVRPGFTADRLARDLTLPRLRDSWPDNPQSAQAGVDEWRAT